MEGIQVSLTQLREALKQHGYKIIPYLHEDAEDVKLRPTAQEEIIRGYNAALEGLARLVRLSNPGATTAPISIDAVTGEAGQSSDTIELATLFRNHGSDKATTHDYYKLYGFLLSPLRQQDFNLLEIGLGTNNIDVLSNMGRNGRPGASLRAFRDWAPRARIFGADVDSRILFEEERIKTFFVDQTKPVTLEALAANFAPKSFDIIIDDGLHQLEPNINTVLFALPLVKDGGVIVVEDVDRSTLPFWETAFSLLPPRCRGLFIISKAASILLIHVGSEGGNQEAAA